MPLKKLAPILLALVLVVLGQGLPAHAAGTPELLYRKHVDAAHLHYENGKYSIQVVDGQTLRPADQIIVRLGPDADASGKEVSRLAIPADRPDLAFLGKAGDIVWNAPQEQLDNWAPVWPGFGVGAFPAEVHDAIFPEQTTIDLVRVDGPGNVDVWANRVGTIQHTFSNHTPGKNSSKMAPGSHGHFNWSFSQPGRYDIYWKGVVHYRDGHVESSPETKVTWYVGTDSDVGLPDGTTPHSPITQPVTGGSEPTVPAPKPVDPLAFNPTKSMNPDNQWQCRFEPASKRATLRGSWDGQLNPQGYVTGAALEYTIDGQPMTVNRSVVEVGEDAKTTMPSAGPLNDAIPAGRSVYAIPAEKFGWDTAGVAYDTLKESIESISSVKAGEGATFVAGTKTGEEWTATGGSGNRLLNRYEAPEQHDEYLYFDRPGFYQVTYWLQLINAERTPAGTVSQGYGNITVTYAVGVDAINNACERSAPLVTPSPTPTPTPSPTPSPSPTPTPLPDGAPTQAPQPAADDRLVLDQGHSDIFLVTPAGDGLNLQLQEDVTGYHVRHDPADVLLKVKPEARMELPEQFAGPLGLAAAYVLPQTQDPNLLWPGWETTEVGSAGLGEVRFDVTVDGPGRVKVFTLGGFGDLHSVLAGGGYDLPGTIVQPFPAHTHANWAFETEGRYTFHVTATAVRDGITYTSPVKDYAWVVGNVPDDPSGPGAPAGDFAGTTTTGTAPSTGGTAGNSGGSGAGASGSGGSAGSGSAGSAAAGGGAAGEPQCLPHEVTSEEKGTVNVATEGHFDMGAQLVDGKLVAALKDDRQQPATWGAPENVAFKVGANALHAAPAGMDFVAPAGKQVYVIGATQEPGVPWLGMNSMHPSIVEGTTGPIRWTLDGIDGPGKVAVFMSGALGGGVGQRVFDNVGGPTEFTLPANTHAHPNWIFTDNGIYHVRVTESATTKDGTTVSASFTLNFAVGDADPAAAGVATTKTTVVGRTADGAECKLSNTGAPSGGLAVLGCGVAALVAGGLALQVARRRR